MPEELDQDRHAQWVRAAVAEHERALVLYATRLLRGDANAGRDVVQDTFLKLCRQSQDDVGPHLASWLFTVCRNRALDVLRKEKRMTLLSEPRAETLHDGRPPVSAALENAEAHTGVLGALDVLPANQQEALRLKFQAGLSYREIAAAMNITASYVGYLICTGLKTVRERIAATEERARNLKTNPSPLGERRGEG